MKKILLATSVLALSAMAANAQAVRIGGEGRMGIIYDNIGLWASTNSAGVTSISNWAQENRLQFNFTVSVQADHGLSFGAFTRARMENGSPAMFSGSRVWVEANNFRLTFGNQDGAFRGVGTSHGYTGGCGVGYVGGLLCGDTAGLLGRTQAFSSLGGGAPSRFRIDYTFGDTRVALSHDRAGAPSIAGSAARGSTEFGIRSRFDAFTVALGYSNRASAAGALGRTVALSGHYNGGTWGVGLLVARLTNGAGVGSTSVTTWSLSANTELGGGNLYGFVGRTTPVAGSFNPGDVMRPTVNTYGIHYGYGLGGGATLSVGAERIGRRTAAAVGVAFNF